MISGDVPSSDPFLYISDLERYPEIMNSLHMQTMNLFGSGRHRNAYWKSSLLLSYSHDSFALCPNDTATDTALLHYLGLYLDVHITTVICNMWGNSSFIPRARS
jgi:hypothetical protein